jgi:hypothetical protein
MAHQRFDSESVVNFQKYGLRPTILSGWIIRFSELASTWLLISHLSALLKESRRTLLFSSWPTQLTMQELLTNQPIRGSRINFEAGSVLSRTRPLQEQRIKCHRNC